MKLLNSALGASYALSLIGWVNSAPQYTHATNGRPLIVRGEDAYTAPKPGT
jgi:hypothetical protein